MNPPTRNMAVAFIVLLLLALVVGGPPAGAQDRDPPASTQNQDSPAAPSLLPVGAVPGAYWTAVGSTGTVDDANQGNILHETAYVRLRPNLVGNAIIRYNVVAVDGLLPGGNTRKISMLTHFHANAGARVITRLCRVPHLGAGAAGCFLTFDSITPPVGTGWQTRTVISPVCQAVDFDFGRYAYVVEARLIQTTPAGIAALSTLRLHATAC